jgi:tRNA threonylcarbamoyladenosine biosynthesis protein TsaB
MNLLGIETSTEFCSLSVLRGGQVFERHFNAGQRHSELALPAVRELLHEAGLEMDAIEGIVYGAGPGSFTGLRIACGIAQGLALARNLPVVGIGTLLALAEDSGATRVIACLDARMGEVYHAVYQCAGGSWMEMHAPALYKPEAVPRLEGGDWVGCGSGFRAHGPELGRRYGGNVARVDADAVPRARAMLRLALPVFASGKGADAAQAAPLYVRDKVALKTSER